jgi:hypothetical protein
MDLEQLRETVETISEGVTEIRNSGITDAALIMLIQEAAPAITIGRVSKKPSKVMIRATLQGLENLERYVFEDGDGHQSHTTE